MSGLNVFKFLDSYTKEDQSVFFGRETETDEIYQRCTFSKTLVVYGRSGTGKTSIIRCGLGNAFNDQDWLPVFIRRNSDINLDVLKAIRQAASQPTETEKSIKAEVRNLYLDHFKPVYLIFDQFEELFIFGDADEISEFFQSVKELTESEENVHLIFVIREEYLANLTEAEEAIPDFLENRIRIEHLTAKKLREVVEKMCEAAGIAMETGFSEELTERMTSGKAPLELSYLQVYLDAIRKKYPEAKQFTKSMIDNLGNFSDVLRNFLQHQLDKLEDPAKGEIILKAFVSAQGTKRLIDLEELKMLAAEFGVLIERDELQSYANQFVDGRILRQLGENGKYELRHDTLAKVIYERITLAEKELLEAKQFVHNAYNRFQKNGTQLRDEDLDYLAPYAKRLYLKDEQKKFLNEAFAKKERRQKRKLRLTQVGVGILLLLLIGAGYLLYQNYQDNQLQAHIDESHRLAKLSKSDEIGDPMLAFLLAEKAHEIYEGPHTHNALLEAYDRGPGKMNLIEGDFVVQLDSNDFLSVDLLKNSLLRFQSTFSIPTDSINFSERIPYTTIFTKAGIWTGTSFILYSGDTLISLEKGKKSFFIPVLESEWSGILAYDSILVLIDKNGTEQKIVRSDRISICKENGNEWLEIFNDTLLFRDDENYKVLPLNSFYENEIISPNQEFWKRSRTKFAYSVEQKESKIEIYVAGKIWASFEASEIFGSHSELEFPFIKNVYDSSLLLGSIIKGKRYGRYCEIDRITGRVISDQSDASAQILSKTKNGNNIFFDPVSSDVYRRDHSNFKQKNVLKCRDIGNNEILILQEVDKDNRSSQFSEGMLTLASIDYNGVENWKIPINLNGSSSQDKSFEVYHSPIFIWLMIYDHDRVSVYTMSREGRVLQKAKWKDSALDNLTSFSDSALTITNGTSLRNISQPLSNIEGLQNLYTEYHESDEVLIQWNDTTLFLYDFSESDTPKSHIFKIENGHKSDVYSYSNSNSLLFRNAWNGNLNVFNIKDGSSNILAGLDLQGGILKNEKYILYLKKQKVFNSAPIKLILVKNDFNLDSLILDYQYLNFNQIEHYLYSATQDTVIEIDLISLKISKYPVYGITSSNFVYAKKGSEFLFYNANYSSPKPSLLTYSNNKIDTLQNFNEFRSENNYQFNPSIQGVFTESEVRFRFKISNSQIVAVYRPKLSFLGKIIEIDQQGEITGELDLSQFVATQNEALDLMAMTNKRNQFIINQGDNSFITNNRLESYFQIDNYLNGFVRDKYILTSHRLLNQYELFPINGEVAIEMVREQGRLGEVRDFTEEEIEKYQLN